MKRLIPGDLPTCKWVNFTADGLKDPVSGVIYPEDQPASNGMPLGGLGTGCIDLETTGLIGYVSAFNSLSPRRGPLNVPLLGVKLQDQTHILAAAGMAGAKPATGVRYWGHYPIADMEFELDAPLSVGVRAWSPFVPGSVKDSMIPAAVFEVRLRNLSDQPLRGTLAASFPGFTQAEALGMAAHREPYRTENLSGAAVGCGGAFMGGPERPPDRPSYVLAVLGDAPTRVGYSLGWDLSRWQAIEREPPDLVRDEHDSSGVSVSTDFALSPRGEQTARFVLAWHAPVWTGAGSFGAWTNPRAFHHYYAREFTSAEQVAQHMALHHGSLLKRILAWQDVIYGEASLPDWLRDCLINILHLIPETSIWGQAKPPIGEWCREEDGLFALNECPRQCPQLECLPCSFYGNLPIVYFFPEAALSTLRGYKAYQSEDGRPAWVFGGCTIGTGYYDLAAPGRGYQASLNGACVVEMVDKLWLRSGDDSVVREFYDLCRRATIWTMSLNTGEGGVIAMPVAGHSESGLLYETEWFEAPEPGWKGLATHVGGVRLAQLRLMARMAEAVGDGEFVQQCQTWFEQGAAAMEKHLWAGDHYLNFYEPVTGSKSELVFGYQLDGQWITRFHGAADAFPAAREAPALETIRRCNVALSKTGAVNYANYDGTPAKVGGYGTYSYFTPELLMLAMTYIYAGKKEFGLELARRCWENVVCTQRLTWDQPNLFRGDKDTGERGFGADYYQNMILWSLVAALEGGNLARPCESGGLVQRMIRAGQAG